LGYTLGDFFTNSSSHTGPSRSAQFCIWMYKKSFYLKILCSIFFTS
jgi:hypothetical protein